jgi:hypothetical protein
LGVAAAILAAGCGSGSSLTGSGGSGGASGLGGGHTGGTGGAGANTFTATFGSGVNVDILMMIDNSSSMTEMQGKLYQQIPSFVLALQSLPVAPNLHLAVVSSDMGAPGDSTSGIGCTASGDAGQFQSAPTTNVTTGVGCTATTLQAGATFISDVNMMPNYTDPLASVFQCISQLGDHGCGFEHQLASIDRALGADGSQAPVTNAGFLRSDAALAIVLLTNEDDCSAPTDTELYSLNGGMSNNANPLGPMLNYRCNRFGHLCTDPATGVMGAPPPTPPADAQGTSTSPTLDLTGCASNDTATGMLTPVSKFVSDIKALKPDPDNQIVVGAIAAPVAPYTVAWIPPYSSQGTQPGELWPQVMHSCGPSGGDNVNPKATQLPTDQSFGDPAVRITQFVGAFPHHVMGSICDASFAATMQAIASTIEQLATPCIPTNVQNDTQGNPKCTVTQGSATLQSCSANGSQPPCWTLAASTTCAGQSLLVNGAATSTGSTSITCTLCPAGASGNGC